MRPLTRETLGKLSSDSRREAAFEVFERTPAPTPKDEAWRYAELDKDLFALALPDEAGDPLGSSSFLPDLGSMAGVATIIDGHVTEISGGEAVAFDTEQAVFGGGGPDLVSAGIDKFAAANLSFGSEGVALRVPRNTAAGPFLIDLQVTQAGSISFPRISVRLEDNSEAEVLVLLRSPDGLEAALAPQLAAEVGDGARLRLTTAQVLGDETSSINHHRVSVGRDASARLGEVGLGASFSRLDLGVRLTGDGSSVNVEGLYFGERSQALDYRMVIDHVGKNTSSDVFLKGAVEDQARSIFTGLLRIERDATRTSAFETNRNLVLSPGAKAHSVPNLEILCDDVVCGHASSVGPLEVEHLYYLMSRGLTRQRAERILVRGFFAEVIKRLPSLHFGSAVEAEVNRRFVEAQAEGRIA
ncbi:MAG: Fe-S cluster assembly protein SufD [Acidimicrobiia bacterium]|nr:Fe-S cluster assembly protein SufD [Acidimicrobiia bacterium]